MEMQFSNKHGPTLVSSSHTDSSMSPDVSPGTYGSPSPEDGNQGWSRRHSDYAKVDLATKKVAKPQESALSLLLSREGSEEPRPDPMLQTPLRSEPPSPTSSTQPGSASVGSSPQLTHLTQAKRPHKRTASGTKPTISKGQTQTRPLAGSASTKPSAAAEHRNRPSGNTQAEGPQSRDGYGFMFGAGEIGNVSSPRHYSIPAIRDRFNPSSVEARFIVNLPRTPSTADIEGNAPAGSPQSTRSGSVASISSNHSSFLSRSLSKLSLSRSSSRAGSSASLRRFVDKPWKPGYSPDEPGSNLHAIEDGSPDSRVSSPVSRSNSVSSSTFAGSYESSVNEYPVSASTGASATSGFKPPHATAGSLGGPRRSLSKTYGKLGKTLGEGAGGHVKIIKSSKDSKIYAVKEFRTKHPLESAREYQKKVGAEYCLGLTLKHPNIVNTVDIIYERDRVYQVMEYCEFDLFAIVMSGKMTVGEVFCDFRQIMDGIRYLHESGLAHRDLKLDNCVVTHQGIVKIIDFGSSVVFRYPESEKRYDSDGVVGSDPYLAPEAAGSQRYDPTATDIWSAAIILCCMLMRKFPWKAPRMSDGAFKTFVQEDPATGQRPGLHKLLTNLPPEVQNLINGMLDLNPETRFDIEQCWQDKWLSSSSHCSLDANGSLVAASSHTHSAVAFEEAHIAMLERKNRKAKKNEKMW